MRKTRLCPKCGMAACMHERVQEPSLAVPVAAGEGLTFGDATGILKEWTEPEVPELVRAARGRMRKLVKSAVAEIKRLVPEQMFQQSFAMDPARGHAELVRERLDRQLEAMTLPVQHPSVMHTHDSFCVERPGVATLEDVKRLAWQFPEVLPTDVQVRFVHEGLVDVLVCCTPVAVRSWEARHAGSLSRAVERWLIERLPCGVRVVVWWIGGPGSVLGDRV